MDIEKNRPRWRLLTTHFFYQGLSRTPKYIPDKYFVKQKEPIKAKPLPNNKDLEHKPKRPGLAKWTRNASSTISQFQQHSIRFLEHNNQHTFGKNFYLSPNAFKKCLECNVMQSIRFLWCCKGGILKVIFSSCKKQHSRDYARLVFCGCYVAASIAWRCHLNEAGIPTFAILYFQKGETRTTTSC